MKMDAYLGFYNFLPPCKLDTYSVVVSLANSPGGNSDHTSCSHLVKFGVKEEWNQPAACVKVTVMQFSQQ